MSVLRLEEVSVPALDALDRARTVVILSVSPLEEHGPHLPLGVDIFGAEHFARAVAERLSATRPGWTAVLAPTIPIGAFTFEAVGTVRVRQRVVRDVLVDYGRSLARGGFRHVLIANGHAGPGHLVALEEAAAIVSRRHGIMMASVTGYMAWQFLRGRYLPRVEAVLGRPLTEEERRALAEDTHGGWWETSLMRLLRPDLVDEGYRTLPPVRYSLTEKLRPNYPLRNGGLGYVGHPGRATDLDFARAAIDVLMDDAMETVEGLLDGRLRPAQRRSPFLAVPFLRTNFVPVVGAALALAAAAWWLLR